MIKYLFVILPFLFLVQHGAKEISPPAQVNTEINIDTMRKFTIKVGNKTFAATLSDNATASAFKSMLPMTIVMTELNGNEKYFDLANSLPTNASRPISIQTGDLMLYGSRTLVLFYETFSTNYSYTTLGRVDDPEGLATALGTGNVTVSFVQ